MKLIIKRLSSDLVEDYIHFFDTTPHDNLDNNDKCYCVGFASVDHRDGKTDFSTSEKRREIAYQYVRNGKLDGYLAYIDNKVIGWCNVNDKNKCLFCGGFSYVLNEAFEISPKRIKSIFCFVISPFYQHQGIATVILNKIIEDAKKEKYDIIESYPNSNFINPQLDFMGPISMYQKQGFEIIKKIGNDKIIMRKFI